MNAGIYAYDERALRAAIAQVGNDNAQGEYYLTDTVELLIAAGHRVVPVPVADYRSVLGVNDRVELAVRERDPQPPAVRGAHARRRHDRRSRDDVSRAGAGDRARRDDPPEHGDLRRDADRRGHEHRAELPHRRRGDRRALRHSRERRDVERDRGRRVDRPVRAPARRLAARATACASATSSSSRKPIWPKASRRTTSRISATPRSARARTSARARSPRTSTACARTAPTIGADVKVGSNSVLVAPVTRRRRRDHRRGRGGDPRRPGRRQGRRRSRAFDREEAARKPSR